MEFGPVHLDHAEGAILAHSLKAGGKRIRKGTVLSATDIAVLRQEGFACVTVARLTQGDVHEDAAAARIATPLAGPGIRQEPAFTGRANLFATGPGLFIADRQTVDTINHIDPAITLATLANYSRVETGRMVATVKIIPFAAPEPGVAAAEALGASRRVLAVKPFTRRRVGLIATQLPSLKPSVMDKTRAVIDERLAPTGAGITAEHRVPHTTSAIAAAIRDLTPDCDLILVFGASAIVDLGDAIPAAVVAAGGQVDHFGMPVDPGNLLMIGAVGPVPVIGAPGCARSPRINGFDWVLDRLLVDIAVTASDIQGMGVGGLLTEIATRPQPRRARPRPADAPDKIAALVLAAGQSKRMGDVNKLTIPFNGEAMVRHPVKAAHEAGLDPIVVVTGHEAKAVREALADLPAAYAHNADFKTGLASSLKAGLAALADDVTATFVLLGDMPLIDAALLKTMAGKLDPQAGHWIVVPVNNEGKWGNPVLFHRRFFGATHTTMGDRGARAVLEENRDAIAFVAVSGKHISRDFDTPESLAQFQ